MEIQIPTFQEKRQFGRIKIFEPTPCQVWVPRSKKIKEYRGLIKNISMGGIFFVCDEKLPLEKDDIRHLIFNVIYNYQKIYRLKVHGLVVRTETVNSQFGIALKFLSDPMFYLLNKIDSELPFMDKIRIMYQNYDVYRKAYDIIKTTSDARNDKIKKITKRLNHNLYRIDQRKLATSMTANLTQTFEKFAAEFYKKFMK
jgi:hypothetical protein